MALDRHEKNGWITYMSWGEWIIVIQIVLYLKQVQRLNHNDIRNGDIYFRKNIPITSVYL